MTTTHTVKCDTSYYEKIVSGEKNFELRFDDRGYKTGDILELAETKERLYYGGVDAAGLHVTHVPTGNTKKFLITYILKGFYGLREGYVVMSIIPYPISLPLTALPGGEKHGT